MLDLTILKEEVYKAIEAGTIHTIESIFYDVVAQGGKVIVLEREYTNVQPNIFKTFKTKEEIKEWVSSIMVL